MAKRIAKRAALVLVLLTVATLLGIATVIAFPRLALNDSALPLLGRLLRGSNIPVTWSNAHWSVENISFFKKRITASAQNLCYSNAHPYTRVCLDEVKATMVFHLWTRKLTVEDLTIPKGSGVFESAADAPPSAEPVNPFAVVQSIRATITSIDWKHISLGNLALLYTNGAVALRVNIAMTGISQPRSLKLHTQGTLSQKGERWRIDASLAITLPKEGELSYALSGSWGLRHDNWKLETSGKIARESLTGSLNADIKKPTPPLKTVMLRACDYSWSEKTGKNHATFHCPDGALQLPLPVGADLTVKADIDLNPKADQPLQGEAQTHVAQFEKLVPLLENTPWAIPAPLNQLKGEVRLTAQAKADASFKKMETAFDFVSRLQSSEQSLHFEGKGNFDLTNLADSSMGMLTAAIEFGDTKLSLPRLDPVNMPRLFPSPQIVYPRNKPKSTFVFDDKVSIRTTKGKPLLLRTNQYGALVPVELDLVHTMEHGLVGTLHTPPFSLEILHRTARVKNIDIKYPEQGAAELTAQVEFHYADYDLTLSAFGKLDSPRYAIMASPPLSENSAWSLLIFGRPLEELSAGQGESLVNARAAITGGAVSALSMYLLASTPVESVGYDPTKGKFMATVRLLEGTSLRIEGVKEGVSSLGIRKRLGRDWVLNTYIERTSPLEDRRSVSTFLDWSHTY
jgi:hypothetical protein